MGDRGEAERPLGESGTKHVHTLALRRHNERLREGEGAQYDRPLGSSSKISLRNFTQVFFVCLFFSKPPETRDDLGQVARSAGEWLTRFSHRKRPFF